MDELCEVLSWRQLGIHDKPVGLLNFAGYYNQLIALFDEMVRREFLAAENRELIVTADRIETLLDLMGLKPA